VTPDPSASPAPVDLPTALPALFHDGDFWLALVLAIVVVVVLSVGQVLATYPGFELDAHRLTRATYGLYLANAIVTMLVVVAFWLINPKSSAIAGLGLGFAFPVIIQSRFTLVGPLGGQVLGSGGVSVDVGAIYNSYTGVFRREMDAAIEVQRQAVIAPIVALFPGDAGVAALAAATRTALAARNIPDAERAVHAKNIDDIVASSVSDEEKKTLLCGKILVLMGREYLSRVRP
jgi:hypothetical protein